MKTAVRKAPKAHRRQARRLCPPLLIIEKVKEIVPQSLYWLLRSIKGSCDSDIESFGDANSSSKNDADERHILMISQDIIHAAMHGRKKNAEACRIVHDHD